MTHKGHTHKHTHTEARAHVCAHARAGVCARARACVCVCVCVCVCASCYGLVLRQNFHFICYDFIHMPFTVITLSGFVRY